MLPVKLPFYARLALTLISVVLIVLILEQGRDIFVPLVFALLISILLYPLNRFFEQKLKLGRALSAMLSLLLFLAVMFVFIYFITLQVVNFTQDLPDLKLRFNHIYNDLRFWLATKFKLDRAQQTEYMNRSINSALETGARSASNLLLTVSGILLLAVFVFIFTFFMLFHRHLLMRFALKLFREDHQDKVKEVIAETRSMINSYVLGLLIEMLIMSVANSALLLVLGVQYAILLGVVAAVLNIIPYIGIYTSIVIIMFVTFANSTLGLALETGAGMLVLHFLDANIMLPRIIGARVKMNPFITIIAVIVGEFLWGVPGMFLFIPVIGIMKLICERVEGMEAWGLLMGVDEVPAKQKLKVQLPGSASTNGAEDKLGVVKEEHTV